MLQADKAFLQKSESFRLDARSFAIFVIAGFAAWALNVFPQMLFRLSSNIWFWVSTTSILMGDILLVYTTFALLKRCGISKNILGLNFSKSFFPNVLIGVTIGLTTILILAAILNFAIPYHFEHRLLGVADAVKRSYSFLLGAISEELLFRGFLLVVFAKRFGWRWGVLIMALPFGLYHFEGGLSLVVSTTFYSFVFALSFILTRSLWCAIITHAIMNILLHIITGLDGGTNSIYKLVVDKQWPDYPIGLLMSVGAAIIISALLYVFISYRKSAESDITVES